MSEGDTSRSAPEIKAGPMITSAVLVGAGTLIALVGLAIGGSHLALATRQWIRELETPPSEMARLKWAQAKTAMAAGAAAWQNGTSADPATTP